MDVFSQQMDHEATVQIPEEEWKDELKLLQKRY